MDNQPITNATHADADRPSLRSIGDGFRFVVREKVILGFFLVEDNSNEVTQVWIDPLVLLLQPVF